MFSREGRLAFTPYLLPKVSHKQKKSDPVF
nr:MAG TPA: hypothetical protein [Caudoviricetes sp.]